MRAVPIPSPHTLSETVQSVVDFFERTPRRFVRLPESNRGAGGRWSSRNERTHYQTLDAEEESEPLNGPDNPFTIDEDEAFPAKKSPLPGNANGVLEP